MSDNDEIGLKEWLGFRERFDYSKAKWLGPYLSGVVILVVGGLFLLAIASATVLLGGAVFGDTLETPISKIGISAVTVALIGAPFVIWRSVVAQKTVDVQEQGHITDRINKAAKGLGAEKSVKRGEQEWTEPNLEVRIVAIYALERISQDSERDHIQIMEILCAYIRQNVGHEDAPLPEGEPTPADWRDWAKTGRAYPRLDVDVALKVIERRGKPRKQLEDSKKYRLGLERAPLRKIILSQRDLTNAYLRNAQMQGAHLWLAKLQGADLSLAELQGANLWRAKLQGADLWAAKLQGANLRGAKLQGADLVYAELQGADLRHAEMDGDTSLIGADFDGAAVRYVNFREVPEIADHLEGMFGDRSVTLPVGVQYPAHWPKVILRYDFETEWRKWREDPEGYKPPEPW